MKFLALNIDFSSPSPDPLGSSRPVQAGVKDGFFPKSGYFAAIILCSMKTVQIGTDMLLIITSNSDKILTGVNVDDLE